MNIHPKAKIYLAEERGCDENERFRSCNTFNCKTYFNEHKQPISDLYALNENTIAGCESMRFQVEESSYVLLLPIVGSLIYKVDSGEEKIVHVNQLQLLHFTQPVTIELFNCYENELIKFIQVWVRSKNFILHKVDQLFTFNLESDKNRLVNLPGENAAKIPMPAIAIGKFAGRKEGVYQMRKQDLFVFVIEGVFEVQSRLLHAGDGLALWHHAEAIELEALSNNAIIFVIEL